MSVKIEFYGEDFAQAAQELVGFVRSVAREAGFAPEQPEAAADSAGCAIAAASAAAQQPYDEDDAPATAERERGKPAPGRARRTKAEIAEDEAADAAERQGEPPAGISTGEDRTDPANPGDDAAAEQDAEDEAADPVNASGPEATRDDVRAEMQAYMNKFDIVRLNADMTSILKARWPDGSVTKLSEIPEDAQSFADVIAALRAKMAG